MFEFAWPWIFALLPLPWLLRVLLPVADSGEPALKVSFLSDLEGLAKRRARANLPTWRQQAPSSCCGCCCWSPPPARNGWASRCPWLPAAATC